MPFRRPRPPTDLERVARIFGQRPGGPVADEEAEASLVGRVRRAVDDATPASDDVSRLDTELRRARRPGPMTMPDALRTSRYPMSSTAVVALLALVVAVGCVFVLRVLWAERSLAPAVAPGSTGPVVVRGTPIAAGQHASDGPNAASAVSSVGPSAGPSTGASDAAVVVHVVGRVAHPGLARLRQGARVADAIAEAGGASRGADLGALNLARLLVDGEQVYVPKVGEAPSAPAGTAVPGGATALGAAGGGSGPGSGAVGGAADGPVVSLNSADVALLDTLPGVGPVLAQRIVDWRREHGRFTSVDELGEVSGIGDKLMARLRPRVAL